MWFIIILTIFLDGIIVYYLPSYFNNLSFFYPMLTVTLISLLYHYYPLKKYYRMCFIVGIIYDLLYSNIFLYHALLFLLLGKINSKVYKVFKANLILKILLVIINIIIYDAIGFMIIKFSHYMIVDINDLFYKISHSLLLNIMLVFVDSFFFKKKRLRI